MIFFMASSKTSCFTAVVDHENFHDDNFHGFFMKPFSLL